MQHSGFRHVAERCALALGSAWAFIAAVLAIHLKLAELLRAVSTARTALVNLEELSDEELTRLRREFARLGDSAKRTGGGASGAG